MIQPEGKPLRPWNAQYLAKTIKQMTTTVLHIIRNIFPFRIFYQSTDWNTNKHLHMTSHHCFSTASTLNGRRKCCHVKYPHLWVRVVVQCCVGIVVEAWCRIVQVAGNVWNFRAWMKWEKVFALLFKSPNYMFPISTQVSSVSTTAHSCDCFYQSQLVWRWGLLLGLQASLVSCDLNQHDYLTIDTCLWRICSRCDARCFFRHLGSISLQRWIHRWGLANYLQY